MLWLAFRGPPTRGGHARPDPLCGYILAKRAFELAARHAAQRGDPGVGPQHLLYGVLQDACDPLGTQLGRRSRRELATLGWTRGRPNPLRLVLEARGIDLSELVAEIV